MSESLIITMLDPISIYPDFLDLYKSFSLYRFILLDSPSKVSGSFLVAELNDLILVTEA